MRTRPTPPRSSQPGIAMRAAMLLCACIAGMALLSIGGSSAMARPAEAAGQFVPGEVIVKFKPETSGPERQAVMALVGVKNARALSSSADRTELLTLSNAASVATAVQALSKNPHIEFAEPNFYVRTTATPNDPAYVGGSQWDMQGATTGNANGSNAAGAWSQGLTGSKKVFVAVIDQGVDYSHPDLAGNIWTNSGETPNNGRDDDANGYVDDVHGFNFVDGNGEVMPKTSGEAHGTHVAGTIGAVGGNGTGIAGINWQTNIISVRALDAVGGDIATVIAAVDYVTQLRTQKGLHIVATNNSWTIGSEYSIALREAIRRGGDAGILFVAAAGNDAADNDAVASYPANYDCRTSIRDWNCVVTVAASNEQGQLASFSNFGRQRVMLAAPGENIVSTVPYGKLAPMSGTSMAAPHVTGALALCASAFRGVSAKEMLALLQSTSAARAALADRVASGGLLDIQALGVACAAKTLAFSSAPTQVAAAAIYTNRIRLEWADTTQGEYGHEIQVARGPAGCTGTFTQFATVGPGLTSYPLTGLAESEFYCVRIRAVRDTSYSAWGVSNMTITWSSNLPLIHGKVLMADGVTPVANAKVTWEAFSGQPTGDILQGVNLSTLTMQVAYSDADGSYVLQASPNVQAYLAVRGASNYGYGVQQSPRMPLGFSTGGSISVSVDTELNLVMPPFRRLSVSVKEGGTDAVFGGVPVRGTSRETGGACLVSGADWMPSPKLAPYGNSCFFAPGLTATTNVDGVALFTVVDGWNVAITNPWTFKASHPQDALRIGTVSLGSNSDGAATVVIPGLVKITGHVWMSDGVTPAPQALVTWNSQQTVAVSADGSYSIAVSSGYAAMLMVSSTSPLFPAGFKTGGELLTSADKVVDFVMPPFRSLAVTVVEGGTEVPQPTALVSGTSREGGLCQLSWQDWNPSPALAYSKSGTGVMINTCSFDSLVRARADASGTVRFRVVDGWHVAINNPWTFSAAHPQDAARIGTVSLASNADGAATLVLPGFVKITGHVWMSDAVTPAPDATVSWTVGGSQQLVPVSPDGTYTVAVPAGIAGRLTVTSSSPMFPAGFGTGGELMTSADKVVDFVMPPFRTLAITVKDIYTHEPVMDAIVKMRSQWGGACQVSWNDWNPSPALAYITQGSGITLRTCWFSDALLGETDAMGTLRAVVVDGWNVAIQNRWYTVATHPLDAARAASAEIGSNADQQVELELPGTPSIPKRPSATVSSNSVTLTWTEPWDAGAYIDYYQVWWATEIDGPYMQVAQGSCAGNIDPTLRACVVDGLTPGVTYYFAIIAHNVVGSSGLSLAASVTPLTGALVPVFGAGTATSTGFTVQVSNFDPSYSWQVTASNGSASINGSGLVTVSGLNAGETATVTVTSTRSDALDGVATSPTYTALASALVPVFGAGTATSTGFTVQVSNFDPSYSWQATASNGSASINGSGLVTVSGLNAGETATVTVTSTRSDALDGVATSPTYTALRPYVVATASMSPGSINVVVGYTASSTSTTVTLTRSGDYGANPTTTITVSSGTWIVTAGTGVMISGTSLSSGNAVTLTLSAATGTVTLQLASGSSPATYTATVNTASKASSTVIVGMGPALNPTFGSVTATTSGFTVAITNFSTSYVFSPVVTSGNGTVSISNKGVLTVSGVTAGPTSVLVSTSRTDYGAGSASLSGGALPVISSFTPTGTVTVGSSITITGTNLWGATAVSIGGKPVPSFTVVNPTTVVLGMFSGATTGLISVTTPYGTATSKSSITYSATKTTPGAITLGSTSGARGAAVLLTGTNLGAATNVTIGSTSVAVPFRALSNSTIVVAIPAGAVSGANTFAVTTPGGTRVSGTFTVLSGSVSPTITTAALSARAGTIVTLSGANLGAISSLMLNGATVSTYSVSSTGSVLVMIPSGATKGASTITISTPGGTTAVYGGLTIT